MRLNLTINGKYCKWFYWIYSGIHIHAIHQPLEGLVFEIKLCPPNQTKETTTIKFTYE